MPKLGIFHAQIVSIVDRCVRELSSAAVDIPFLQSIMSLSDNVQGFCKVSHSLTHSLIGSVCAVKMQRFIWNQVMIDKD